MCVRVSDRGPDLEPAAATFVIFFCVNLQLLNKTCPSNPTNTQFWVIFVHNQPHNLTLRFEAVTEAAAAIKPPCPPLRQLCFSNPTHLFYFPGAVARSLPALADWKNALTLIWRKENRYKGRGFVKVQLPLLVFLVNQRPREPAAHGGSTRYFHALSQVALSLLGVCFQKPAPVL